MSGFTLEQDCELRALVWRAFDSRNTPAFRDHVAAVETWFFLRGVNVDRLDAELERLERRHRRLLELRRRDLVWLLGVLDRTNPDQQRITRRVA